MLKTCKKFVINLIFLLFGSLLTIVYFRYRAGTEFIPHISELTGMSDGDVLMIETFEWPLDILFVTIPLFIICFICLIAMHFFKR